MCACICVIALMSIRSRGCVRPQNDGVKIMKACARYFSPQGSHMLHTNPPVSQHVTHRFLHVKGLLVLARYMRFSYVYVRMC